MRPDGFVLAGGRSQRMGVDKARVAYRHWPMAVAVAEVLRAVCDRVVLVRRGPDDGLPWVDPRGAAIEVVRDGADDAHPLWGVAAALEAARSPVALVVPCDVPGIELDVLRSLIAAAPAIAGSTPLVGAYPAAWAARAREVATRGGSAWSFAEGAARIEVELVNLNRPEDLPGPPDLPDLDGERERLRARGALPAW